MLLLLYKVFCWVIVSFKTTEKGIVVLDKVYFRSEPMHQGYEGNKMHHVVHFILLCAY